MKSKYKYLQYALHAAVLIGLVVAGLKYVNGEAFTRALRQFNWSYAPIICLLSLFYVLVKGWRFTRMMRHLEESVPRRMLMRAYVAGQACTLLPGGGAARAALLKQVGIPPAATAAPLAITAFTDQITYFLCTLLAALWFEAARKPVLIFLGVLTVISILLGVEASRTWLLSLMEKLMGRFKLENHWQEFLASLKSVATPGVLLAGLGETAVAFAGLIFALHLTMLGVGAQVPPMTLLLAFALPTMLGRISAMPGGIGVTEAGMVSILDHSAGVSLNQAAAAVAVYRLGTVFFAALVGGAVYLLAWRGNKEKAKLVENTEPKTTEKTTDTSEKMKAAA
jgi:uncharacterized protein (TIRG00374 family)